MQEEQLAEEVWLYPTLYNKSDKGCKERDVIINAWYNMVEKLDFIEDGRPNLILQHIFYSKVGSALSTKGS